MRAVSLEPMTWAEFVPRSRLSIQGFAAQRVAAGLDSEPEATAYASEFFEMTLPEGLATPTHAFWTVHEDDGPTVGHLWLRVRPTAEGVEAFVFDVEISAGARGRGLGRATMLAAEAVARDLGATAMRLNVFAHNEPARALYTALGYAVDTATLSKDLDPTPTPAVPGGVVLRNMTCPEYDAARPALDRAAGGRLGDRLPHGPATSGHRLWTAWDGSTAVGRVWLHLLPRPEGVHGYVRWLEVPAVLRGRGHGRTVAAAVEEACRELGVLTVRATVTGPAVPARRLAEAGGLSLTDQTMQKPL